MIDGGDLPPGPATIAPGVRVTVEVLLLGADNGALVFRRVVARLRRDEHPDARARDLAELPASGIHLLHSTSWRFDGVGIVLTYAALPASLSTPDTRPAVPDTRPAVPDTRPMASDTRLAVPGARPVGDGVVGSSDPLAPSPDGIGPADVAAHACRHLSYLRHTDPLVAGRALAAPEVWDLIDMYEPALAGAIP